MVPFIPSSAPFTTEQRAWLNGFLAGVFADANIEDEVPAPKAAALSLLVMFGSQTGTAERLAKKFASEARQRNFAPQVLELNSYAKIDLSKEERLVIFTSTWGDGDPPDNAAAFWAHLNSPAASKLGHLQFAVLGLGDKNYADFCGAGKKFDARLEELGAKRLQPRAECDLDYEAAAKSWIDALWKPLGTTSEAPTPAPPPAVHVAPEPQASVSPSRNHPFTARLLTNRKLNGTGSIKDTRHFEISLKGSGLSYEVGDALGVLPTNCPALVSDIMQALGCDGEEAVLNPSKEEVSLRNALLHGYQITQVPPEWLRSFAQRCGDSNLNPLIQPDQKAELDKFLYGRDLLDLLLQFPGVKLTPAEFVTGLRKLQPRLYSISSSLKAHPDEVHLTVAAVRYDSHGRPRKGVCSTFLADRVKEQTPVPIFVQPSHGFKLPQDPARPIIMVGPGTGIAPFRAFLEERRAIAATGGNWLFFGDQQQSCDFLYQDELEAMRRTGTLTRLDTAFSRDQAEKVYVQHRMVQAAPEIWAWLESGAHFYVCGDAKRMAKDVDAALRQVIQTAGGKSPEQTEAYIQNLKTDKRYQRDVY